MQCRPAHEVTKERCHHTHSERLFNVSVFGSVCVRARFHCGSPVALKELDKAVALCPTYKNHLDLTEIGTHP